MANILAKDLIAKFQYALMNRWGYIWGTAGEQWTAEKQAAIERTTDEDREKARMYGSKWIGCMVADCSGLFSWAFRQLGGYMYHGSNTMWNKYCVSQGELRGRKRTDGKTLKPGTAVFTYNAKKKNRGHVGLYIGDGKVIEASGTQAGVITTSVGLSKWVEWGELKGVDYGEAKAEKPVKQEVKKETAGTGSGYPTLRNGSKGEYVSLLQTMLVNKGYDIGSYGVDGSFGNSTMKAVMAFQRDSGLDADGIVGAKTWAALTANNEKKKTYAVTVHGLTHSEAMNLSNQFAGRTVNIAEE